MDTQEKIQKIKEAVNLGIPKSHIDCKQGKEVKKLLNNKFVNKTSINIMYKNALELIENPNKRKEQREKYKGFKPEIPKKTKIEEIKKAYKQGATKMSLDPEGHGDTIRRLFKGQNVGIAKINQVYAHLLELQAEAPEFSNPNDLEKKVLEQGKQISYLLNKIGTLETNVKNLTKKLEEKEGKKKQKKY